MAISVGQFLINDNIPEKYRIGPNSSSKDIKKKFEEWAKNDPQSYSRNITEVKNIADKVTMYEGLSIGLDDISPMKKERESFLKSYQGKFDRAKTDADRKQIVSEATSLGADIAMKGKGSLVQMVHTGTKGNSSQLMKNILSPVSSRELDGTPYPYLINNSYSEGLNPGEYWVAAIEARNATVEGKTKTAIPGDYGKQMFNTLNSVVVTTKDCGTNNGMYLSVDDPNVLDRYLAKNMSSIGSKNSLVTSKMVMTAKKRGVKELFVRSPMTCEARNGVCQLCYGLNPSGQLHNVGANVGTIAAQSLSEPLTQMTLQTKHGTKLSGKSVDDVGMKGVVKLLSKPKVFPNKATLSIVNGKVEKIVPAPQGGYYIYINGVEHYIGAHNEVVVKKGQVINKGDSLSNGLKDPREVAELRGLGSSRVYYVDALYNAYNPLDEKSGKRTGMPIDKRHLEVLAKKDLNHVIINSHNDTFSRGDIVEYNKLKEYLGSSKKEVPIKEALGEFLGKEYFHYTVGTEIVPPILEDLKRRGLKEVIISTRKIDYTPYVTSLKQVPLLKENFIARLSHQEIKSNLIEAATEGLKSEIKGYDPIPSFIRGVEFGEGTDGAY